MLATIKFDSKNLLGSLGLQGHQEKSFHIIRHWGKYVFFYKVQSHVMKWVQYFQHKSTSILAQPNLCENGFTDCHRNLDLDSSCQYHVYNIPHLISKFNQFFKNLGILFHTSVKTTQQLWKVQEEVRLDLSIYLLPVQNNNTCNNKVCFQNDSNIFPCSSSFTQLQTGKKYLNGF